MYRNRKNYIKPAGWILFLLCFTPPRPSPDVIRLFLFQGAPIFQIWRPT